MTSTADVKQQQRALANARSGKLARHGGDARSRTRPPLPTATTTTATGSPPERDGDREGSNGDDDSRHGLLPVFLRYDDLEAAKIIRNWTTLFRLIDKEGFPAGIMIGPNTRAWTLDEVEAWLASRPSGRKTMPTGCVPAPGEYRAKEWRAKRARRKTAADAERKHEEHPG